MCDEMTITREQAEAALAAVQERYKGFEDEITLIENWDRTVPWLITWEEGPYEWAYRATMGGVNTEVASELAAEFGTSRRRAVRAALESPIVFPPGVFAEPYHSFSLTLSEG